MITMRTSNTKMKVHVLHPNIRIGLPSVLLALHFLVEIPKSAYAGDAGRITSGNCHTRCTEWKSHPTATKAAIRQQHQNISQRLRKFSPGTKACAFIRFASFP